MPRDVEVEMLRRRIPARDFKPENRRKRRLEESAHRAGTDGQRIRFVQQSLRENRGEVGTAYREVGHERHNPGRREAVAVMPSGERHELKPGTSTINAVTGRLISWRARAGL